MVKVTVTPDVEAGLDKGGEDLNLVVVARHEGDTPPVDAEFEVAVYVCDGDGYNQQNEDFESDEEYADVRVHYCTHHYEFEWEGEGKDALALEVWDFSTKPSQRVTVEQYLRNPANWKFDHKPGESPRLVCEVSAYVGGNAD